MRQMAAMREVKSQDLISGLQAGKKDSSVCLCAGVWLYIGPGSTKKCFDPVDCKRFNLIYDFTTSVIAPTRITFGVFVGQTGPHGVDYGLAREIFGSNELYSMALAMEFFFYQGKNNIRHGGKYKESGIFLV